MVRCRGGWLTVGLLGVGVLATGCKPPAREGEASSTTRGRAGLERTERRPGAAGVLGEGRHLREGMSGAGGMAPLGTELRPDVFDERGHTAPSVYPPLRPRRR